MKKWVMPLVVVAAAIAGSAFAFTACGNDDDGPRQYEVTLRFNTSVTQEDMEEAQAILRAFDETLDFVVMESFPPIGRALLQTNASDFCSTVEEQVEAKSYVDGVSCQPWQESDDAGPDVPVESTRVPVVETSPTPAPSPTAATMPNEVTEPLDDEREPQQALSVSELLANPVYDQEVKVWGEVSLLGELFCPCFELTSQGEAVVVWYDLMVEDDGTHRPPVATEGIENGDTVIVSGELKRAGTHTSISEVWAKTIRESE
jgi:hypothetical protein